MTNTVIITGSTRGLGLEMAKQFRANGWNVIINGVNSERLQVAVEILLQQPGTGSVDSFQADVASPDDLRGLARFATDHYDSIDIWINNAGINQPMKALWELTDEEVDNVLDTDLRGAIIGSRIAVSLMENQPTGGFIYNLEGYGSNDATMLGLNMYGTSKRAVTHFTRALAKELEVRNSKAKAGLLSPGIMITNFTTTALGGKQEIDLPEKTKKVYNILGDYPDTVAEFLVKRILTNVKNDRNNAHIQWLTGRKAAWRFMTAGFRKKDFF